MKMMAVTVMKLLMMVVPMMVVELIVQPVTLIGLHMVQNVVMQPGMILVLTVLL